MMATLYKNNQPNSLEDKVARAGDTMTGKLIAQSNTDYTIGQVRNIILGTTDPTSSLGNNGDIYIKYKV